MQADLGVGWVGSLTSSLGPTSISRGPGCYINAPLCILRCVCFVPTLKHKYLVWSGPEQREVMAPQRVSPQASAPCPSMSESIPHPHQSGQLLPPGLLLEIFSSHIPLAHRIFVLKIFSLDTCVEFFKDISQTLMLFELWYKKGKKEARLKIRLQHWSVWSSSNELLALLSRPDDGLHEGKRKGGGP